MAVAIAPNLMMSAVLSSFFYGCAGPLCAAAAAAMLLPRWLHVSSRTGTPALLAWRTPAHLLCLCRRIWNLFAVRACFPTPAWTLR